MASQSLHGPSMARKSIGMGCYKLLGYYTFAPTYLPIPSAAAGPGSVAEHATTRKRSIYSTSSSSHIVMLVAFETSGVFGSDALQFVREIVESRILASITSYIYMTTVGAVVRRNLYRRRALLTGQHRLRQEGRASWRQTQPVIPVKISYL